MVATGLLSLYLLMASIITVGTGVHWRFYPVSVTEDGQTTSGLSFYFENIGGGEITFAVEISKDGAPVRITATVSAGREVTFFPIDTELMNLVMQDQKRLKSISIAHREYAIAVKDPESGRRY